MYQEQISEIGARRLQEGLARAAMHLASDVEPWSITV